MENAADAADVTREAQSKKINVPAVIDKNGGNNMEKTLLNVDGMSCEHCVKAITKAVGALPGVAGVNVDLAAKTVTVEHDAAQSPPNKIKAEIEDQGYEIVQ